MQYSLHEMQAGIEREIRENASTRFYSQEATRAKTVVFGMRILTLVVLALFMLPLSFS